MARLAEIAELHAAGPVLASDSIAATVALLDPVELTAVALPAQGGAPGVPAAGRSHGGLELDRREYPHRQRVDRRIRGFHLDRAGRAGSSPGGDPAVLVAAPHCTGPDMNFAGRRTATISSCDT